MKPYYYERANWWKRVDLESVAEELKEEYIVQKLNMFDSKWTLSMNVEEREKIRVIADTLTVRLAPMRAFLFQRRAAPFTLRDLKLKNIVFKLYKRTTMSPLPFSYKKEPVYTMSEKI